MDSYDAVLKGLQRRKFSPNAMKQCGLFIDTEKGYIDRFRNRVMFDICNIRAEAIAFAGRTFNNEDTAKYMNSPETKIYNKSKVLYGLQITKNDISKLDSAIIVEGYFDFLQLFQSGIHNIVAVSGTATRLDLSKTYL